MARIRRSDSKAVLGQQRAQLRRGARGKAHIGDDTGSAAARAAERAKVHRMQEVQHAREEGERLQPPVVTIVVDLVADAIRIARTFATLPFRVGAALLGRHPAEA